MMMDAAPATGQAYQIFARVQQRWAAQMYPPSVDYVIHVQTSSAGRTQDRHYRARWNAERDLVSVDAVSQEERAHPYKPSPGVVVKLFGKIPAVNVGGPREGTGVNGDLIGVPMLTPNYFFGIAQYTAPQPPTPAEIVREIRDEYHDPAPSKVAAVEKTQPLRTIASVYSSNYTITLVGKEPVDGHSDYHLKLQPLRDPGKHRLRDLWADESTYDVDRLRIAGNFIDRGTLGVPWMVTFATVNHARYIATETSERGISHWYDRITIRFEDLAQSVGPFYPARGGESTIREP